MISKPGPYPITIEQGQAFERVFRIKTAGETVNLTGYSALAAIKLRPQDVEAVLELATGNGLTVGETGITMRLTKEQTKQLPVKKMTWSLRIVEPDGDPYPILEGTFTVGPQRAGA